MQFELLKIKCVNIFLLYIFYLQIAMKSPNCASFIPWLFLKTTFICETKREWQ